MGLHCAVSDRGSHPRRARLFALLLRAAGWQSLSCLPSGRSENANPWITRHVCSSLHIWCRLPKVLFWSFIAGFSEKFATNIMGQFESKAAEATLNQTQQKKPEDEA